MVNREKLLARARQYWEPESFFRLDATTGRALGLRDADAEFLAEVGLPEWSAPNLWIHEPSLADKELLLIGDAREDGPVCYRLADGAIFFVDSDGRDLLLAFDLEGLLHCLSLYAEMVEDALRLGDREAFTKNRIPDNLIDRFALAIAKEFEGCGREGGYWAKEVARLRSHVSKPAKEGVE